MWSPFGRSLFGLGFDTATEVALLVLAGTSAAAGLPWYAIMCLPILFAAGMSLLDILDGSFMNFAYGWALSEPVRKVYYNITITGLSVAVALIIGSIQLLGLLAEQLGWTGGFWDWLGGIDLNWHVRIHLGGRSHGSGGSPASRKGGAYRSRPASPGSRARGRPIRRFSGWSASDSARLVVAGGLEDQFAQ